MRAARKLKRRAVRDDAGAFLVEGPLLVLEAIRAGAAIDEIFIDESTTRAGDIREAAVARGVRLQPATAEVVAALSDTTTPQGVVAVVRDTTAALGDISFERGLAVVLAAVRDPGNAGTLVRSSVGAGADAVVFARGSVDPLNAKCVRASAGTMFHIPVVRGVALRDALEQLRRRGLALLGTDARAEKAVHEVDLTRPSAIVLGNEAWGLPPECRELVDEVVGIPMPGHAESLNVGIAGSVLLFEAVRQRKADLSSAT